VADGFSANIRGLKEVDEALASLGPIAGEKVMRSVLFSSATPILDRTKSGLSIIQRGSGALAKATRRVYLKAGASTRGGGGGSGSRFTVAVAPKVKDQTAIALANLHYKGKKPIRGVFWGHLLEWGHRVATRSSGRLSRSKSVSHSGGRVAGRFVFSRAAEAAAPEAISLFKKLIFSRVDAAVRKAKKIQK
jgi:hypothetical protein